MENALEDYVSDMKDVPSGAFARHAAPVEREPNKRLILLRHGDPESRAALKEQVRHTRDQLYQAYPDLDIDAVLYSPMRRTVRTAGEFYRLHTAELDGEIKGLVLPFERQKWLKDDSGTKIGYDGLLKRVQELDDDWDTVLLVTHSTTGPLLAKALKTQADDMQLASAMFDYASVMVIDLPVKSWEKAGSEPAILALTIAQPEKPDPGRAAATETAPEDIISPD